MRDISHAEQIRRWAEYVKNNPNWKEKIKPFLDAQIIMARRAYDELNKTKEGKEKIKKLKNLC